MSRPSWHSICGFVSAIIQEMGYLLLPASSPCDVPRKVLFSRQRWTGAGWKAVFSTVGLAQCISPCAFLAQSQPLFLLATLISIPYPSLESLWSWLSLWCVPAWSILARRQLELDNIHFLQELNVQRAPPARAPVSCGRQRGENDFETQ